MDIKMFRNEFYSNKSVYIVSVVKNELTFTFILKIIKSNVNTIFEF
jgi:hypothetical protein